MKILNLHGFMGKADNRTYAALCELMPEEDIVSPSLDFMNEHPEKLFNKLAEIIRNENIDIVIGQSLGGFYALPLAISFCIPCILTNPCFFPAETGVIVNSELSMDILEEYRKNSDISFYSKAYILISDNDTIIPGNFEKCKAITPNIRQVEGTHSNIKNLKEELSEILKLLNEYSEQIDLTELYCYDKIKSIRAELSIGTLGGGNHFIEADKSEDGSIYIVIHSGSRHLGVETATYYQEKAFFNLAKNREDVKALIEMYKQMGKEKKIEEAIRRLKNTGKVGIPKHLCYCEGELFDQYIHDMKIVQQFAMINRQAMMDEIIKGMHLHVEEQFTTTHNYIDTETMILRKGAVSAKAGEKLLIPINMRDGSLICTGKGNPDWNYSAPHGAGRLMSRSEAKQSFTVSEFKKQMDGIYTTSVNAATLDECPMAYKSMEDIVDNIGDTVEINEVIKPIYNFKAGEE